MKTYIFYTLFILLSFSCTKQENEIAKEYCNNAKVIKATCGGTVVQVLKPNNIGSDWLDSADPNKPSYRDCILVGNLAVENQKKGEVLSIVYEVVTGFKEGGFCDIGGLPPTKAIIKINYDDCTNEINQKN